MTDVGRGREPRVASLWGRVILLVVIFLVFSYFAGFLVVMQRGALEGTAEGQAEALARLLEDPAVVSRLLFIQALIGLAAVAGMTLLVDRRPLTDLGIGGGRGGGAPNVLWGLGLGVVLASAVALFISAVGGRHVHPEFFGDSRPISVGGIVVMLTAASFMEEIFFRGYLHMNLKEGYGPGRTILLTAMGFATIHGANPGGAFLAWFNIFLIGVVLGQLRELTGGLPVPFGLHLGWNLALGMGFGVPVSGVTLPSALRIFTADLPAALSGGEFGPEASAVLTALFGGVALVLARRRMPPGDDTRTAGG